MNVIVDVQGFKSELNEFIPKEIAILSNRRVFVILIKPPCPFYDLTKKERLQVAWIEKNRGIYWNQGFIPHSNYKNIIDKILENKCIFTKGFEKVLWLRSMLKNSNIHNLEDRNCPSLISLYDKYLDSHDIVSCMYHDNICALKNVCSLNKWCIENNVFLIK